MKISVLIRFSAHHEGQQVVIDTELLIDLVKVGVLALHKQIDLLLRQHHLKQIGLQAAGVVEEEDVLVFRGGVPDEPHIELAHAGVVVVHLRNQNFVDILEVDAGRKTLLGAEQYPVSTVPQSFPQGPPLGKGFGGAGDGEQGAVRQIFPDRLGIGV